MHDMKAQGQTASRGGVRSEQFAGDVKRVTGIPKGLDRVGTHLLVDFKTT